MYNAFRFDKLLDEKNFTESFNLSIDRPEPMELVFTEAVFTDGKTTMAPVVKAFQNLKDLLTSEITNKSRTFVPRDFVKSLKFKELEDALRNVFGFRNVDVMCTDDDYDAKREKFYDTTLNCYTWPTWRYPIDGLVTDKGFYDNTHSINSTVVFTLSLLNQINAEQCTAILLHEIGHNLDPAIVDINYAKTNIFSKYLTDRKNKLNAHENKMAKSGKLNCIPIILLGGVLLLAWLIKAIVEFFKIITFDQNTAITEIKRKLKEDEEFSRVTNQEAFADNFARMYGFGAHLMAGLNVADKYYSGERNSRIKNEKLRQWAIASMAQAAIKDVHKTDMHRINSLIREYEADLNDPKIPSRVKEDITNDLAELKLVQTSYLHDRSEFEKRINQTIKDELEAANIKFDKARDKKNTSTEDDK